MESVSTKTHYTMREEPLEFYVDKLKKGEHFSLIRFGDGEFYCLWGLGGTQNSNGCRYTPELRQDLADTFRHAGDPSFLFGMQHVLPGDRKRAEELYPVEWYDSEIFGDSLVAGKLFPLIEQLRKMKTVVIGNGSIREAVHRVFGNDHFIIVPPANAHEHKDRVLRECEALAPATFLFSCGMAANAFIADLHGIENSYFLDMGHIWDAFAGNMSRCNLEGKTKEEIERNLHP